MNTLRSGLIAWADYAKRLNTYRDRDASPNASVLHKDTDVLTDIFANRYATVPLWETFTGRERRLLVQSYRILAADVCPYYRNGNEYPYGKKFWTDIQSRLSRELGVQSLSDTAYAIQTPGAAYPMVGTWSMNHVCETWMLKDFDGKDSADRFIKERLSLIELGFRRRGEDIVTENAERLREAASGTLFKPVGTIRLPGDPIEGAKAANAAMSRAFQATVDELNARFRQTGCGLNYHNGFIQRAVDALVTDVIENPFWSLVSDPKWKNVDLDMKEAFDRRDGGDRDPAFPAARALESTIKIISDERGWTRGNERGAASYVDNLKRAEFLSDWEAEGIKSFFSKVRNPLGHGPGTAPMPTLTRPQTTWAIETCIVWINSLIRRM
jgi:hypothetical protein